MADSGRSDRNDSGEKRMFTIEQWLAKDEYLIRILLDDEPLAVYKLNRKATDDELKQMLETFSDSIGKAIDHAILYGTEEEGILL